MPSLRARTTGFSLIELLVVLSIIGLLISLLIPAVQAARESARKLKCQSNLRQLALGLNAYHASCKAFPPAMNIVVNETGPGYTTEWKENWVISLLPYIDQQPLHDSFELDKLIKDDANRTARGTRLALMLCPTDVGSDVLYSREGEGDNWARGNYGANGSLAQLWCLTPSAEDLSKNDNCDDWWKHKYLRGAMSCNKSLSASDITDGLSNTILLGELRIGLCDKDRRGTWAMGAVGASAIFGHGVTDDSGPNNCIDVADDILGGQDVADAFGLEYLGAACMGCYGKASVQATMRSLHADGVNVGLCDGSVRFLNNSIEHTVKPQTDTEWHVLNHPEDFKAWERLNASADGLSMGGAAY